MTQKDDPEGQKPVSRLFSVVGLKLFLIVILSVTILSFMVLGLVRPRQPTSLTQPPGQNKIYKPIVLKPGQFEIKTAKAGSDARDVSEPAPTPVPGDKDRVAQETTLLPGTSKLPLATTVTTSTTTTSIPTTTEPTIILGPGEAVKVAAKKFNLPPPKWQTLDKNWDKVKLTESPKLDDSKLKGSGWKQLELGQAENVRVGSEAETSTVATVRTKAPKKPKQPTTTLAKTASSKKKIRKPRPLKKPSKTISKAGLNLAILNESGKAGMGEVYRDVLQAMGYPVMLVKDRQKKPGITTIYYKPGAKSQARLLGDRIPEEKRLAPLTWASRFDIVVMIR